MPDKRKVFVVSNLCTGCRTCEIACAVEHSQSKTLLGAISEELPPRYRIQVQAGDDLKLPLNCLHCEEPDCLFACKSGAVSKNPETGQVSVDMSRCVGCWMCVMVCPFGAAQPDHHRGKVIKCDLCEGRAGGPACVEACPTRALFYGTNEEFRAFIEEMKQIGIIGKSA